MSETKRTCVFCGGGNLNQEHIPPSWVSQFLPIIDGRFWMRTSASKEGIKEAGQSRVAASQTVRTVCATCNNGWMRGLEDRAKPILGPMLQGIARRLTPLDQVTIATWFLKCALVIGSMKMPHERGPFGRAFEFFHQTRQPDDDYLISIGTFSAINTVFMSFHPNQISKIESDGTTTNYPIFHSIILVGHVFGSVILRHPNIHRDVPTTNPFCTTRIWPRQKTFLLWPDKPHYPAELLEELKAKPIPDDQVGPDTVVPGAPVGPTPSQE